MAPTNVSWDSLYDLLGCQNMKVMRPKSVNCKTLLESERGKAIKLKSETVIFIVNRNKFYTTLNPRTANKILF